MDIRAVVAGFRGVEPLPGLPDSWHWSPAPGIDFAGALSADGKRLLQLSGRNSYDQDLAVRTLRFARDQEDALFARNPFPGSLDGFELPAGHRFDAVVGIASEVHRFYRVENSDLTPPTSGWPFRRTPASSPATKRSTRPLPGTACCA
ncbi:hypothetical protein ACKI1I_17900 [Streptomyces turgidiscabies]|uniref:Uncharacterized protein n=1 Tax=Streptomyces turgidiscabies (strain Car8) TaxID=698760 RepID=L7FFA1_STRT8|nr:MULTISPECIES: hypothetical protein [Streptomyces]ELP69982.1 hypothetical protein STRTUCAR8_07118 [Streptomyces turgidiscabies Car8]MDX3498008.1 hypothetical protein [Streptomyces turgidiscabies]GAQ69917.1 hypothetical protein T45_01648 [Streptomyces turgidiscabies]